MLALTSVTGVARVVAVVAGDPQDAVLDVVHPVVCQFGAAVREGAATRAPARRRCARQEGVFAVKGLEPDARLLAAFHSSGHDQSDVQGRRDEKSDEASESRTESKMHQQLAH